MRLWLDSIELAELAAAAQTAAILTWPSGRQERVEILGERRSELGPQVYVRLPFDGRKLWLPAGWVETTAQDAPGATIGTGPRGRVGGAA